MSSPLEAANSGSLSHTYYWEKPPLEVLVESWHTSLVRARESALISRRFGVHSTFLQLLYWTWCSSGTVFSGVGCKEFMEKGTLHVAIIHTAPTWKHWVRQNSKVCSGAERVLWKWSEFLNSVLGKLTGVSYSYTLKYVWLTTLICVIWTFELVSLVAQMVKHLPAVRESWVWSLGWKDPLKKEMATHSSTLTWKIAWTGEPGRLQPMGSQKT